MCLGYAHRALTEYLCLECTSTSFQNINLIWRISVLLCLEELSQNEWRARWLLPLYGVLFLVLRVGHCLDRSEARLLMRRHIRTGERSLHISLLFLMDVSHLWWTFAIRLPRDNLDLLILNVLLWLILSVAFPLWGSLVSVHSRPPLLLPTLLKTSILIHIRIHFLSFSLFSIFRIIYNNTFKEISW